MYISVLENIQGQANIICDKSIWNESGLVRRDQSLNNVSQSISQCTTKNVKIIVDDRYRSVVCGSEWSLRGLGNRDMLAWDISFWKWSPFRILLNIVVKRRFKIEA